MLDDGRGWAAHSVGVLARFLAMRGAPASKNQPGRKGRTDHGTREKEKERVKGEEGGVAGGGCYYDGAGANYRTQAGACIYLVQHGLYYT